MCTSCLSVPAILARAGKNLLHDQFVTALVLYITGSSNDLNVFDLGHRSQPSLAAEYGDGDFVVVQSLLQSLQKLVQEATASSVSPVKDNTVRLRFCCYRMNLLDLAS